MNQLKHAETANKSIKIVSILGILFIAANLRAPFTALPPLLEPIMDAFWLNSIETGALTTLPLLAFAIISPLSAPFSRRFSFEKTLFFALITIALGILWRSLGDMFGLYAGTCLIGVGIAFGNVLLPSLIKRDFPQHVTSLTGAYALMMGAAAALGSAVVVPFTTHLDYITVYCADNMEYPTQIGQDVCHYRATPSSQ
ncbi:hypothetical protein RHO15_07140 [Utexia brackfieldae]